MTLSAFVLRTDPPGNTLYSSFLGGTDVDYLYALALDAAGDAYVAGYTNSPDFPHTANAVQTVNAGSTDVVAGVYDSAGGKFFATYHGGLRAHFGRGIAFEREAGIAYVTGYSLSTNYPTTAGSPAASQGSAARRGPDLAGRPHPTQPALPDRFGFEPGLYDNGNPQTTGVFRDWTHNVDITEGLYVEASATPAINFKNVGAINAVDSVTFHDTTPAQRQHAETHRGTSFLEADVLVHDLAPGTPNMSPVAERING